jgi:hypothetical protein
MKSWYNAYWRICRHAGLIALPRMGWSMSTISGTVTHGVKLGQAGYASPLTITAGGYIKDIRAHGDAIYASGIYANAVVVNYGSIVASRRSGTGVELLAGGSVANKVAGLIKGYVGVNISGDAGTVSNSGTIVGTGTHAHGANLVAGNISNNAGLIEGYAGVDISAAAGTVSNSATIVALGEFGRSVGLYAGGNVGNDSAGLIEGGGGVTILNDAGTVTNSGTIIGRIGDGVYLQTGGSVGNNGGLIKGKSYGVRVLGFAGTVSNAGTIDGVEHYGVKLYAGGSIGNGATTALIEGGAVGVVITGATGAVSNSGTIVGTGAHAHGVNLVGGSVSNNAGLIEGYAGVDITGAAGIVSNSATIVALGEFGRSVALYGGGSVANDDTGLIEGGGGVTFINDAGTVTNSGTIIGKIGDGVYLQTGGSVGNNAGLIEGVSYGVRILSSAGTVSNAGTIEGTDHYGVKLYAGGSVGNATTTALIEGGTVGVVIAGEPGTVTNSGTIASTTGTGVDLVTGGTVVDSGTITGGDGTAVSFGGTGDNLLALENGYKLGGGVSVAGTANTLELLGSTGGVSVDFDKAGAGFTDFSSATFGAASGNSETLTITDGAVLPGMISGFTQPQDIVDLTTLNPQNATATLNTSDQLVVGNGSQSVSLQLDPSENYSGIVWTTAADGNGGTDVKVAQSSDTSFNFDDISTVATAGGDATAAIPPSPVPGYSNAVLFLAPAGSVPPAGPDLTHGPAPPFG